MRKATKRKQKRRTEGRPPDVAGGWRGHDTASAEGREERRWAASSSEDSGHKRDQRNRAAVLRGMGSRRPPMPGDEDEC